MGIDRLEKNWDDSHLEEEEVQRLTLEDSVPEVLESDFRFCLVGRLLTDRAIDIGAFKNMMAALWRPVLGLGLKNWFITVFFSNSGMNWIFPEC